MKEWDVFTLALLNFHRTPERESAAVENNRTPFRKKFFVSTTTKRLGSIRAAGGCVMVDLFFRTPHRRKGGRSKKEEKAAIRVAGPRNFLQKLF